MNRGLMIWPFEKIILASVLRRVKAERPQLGGSSSTVVQERDGDDLESGGDRKK